MTNEMIMNILMAAGNTAFDAKKHAASALIYEDTDADREGFIRSMCDDDAADMWEALQRVEYNGTAYRIDYVL